MKCIIAPTTVGIAAAAQVVTQQDKCEQVIVTGLGLPSEMREFVKSGCVQQNALWNFEDIGYLAAYAAHAVLAGDITGEEGETFEAGRLGEITLEADGVVYAPDFSSSRRRTSTNTPSKCGSRTGGGGNAPASPPSRVMPQ